MYRCRRHSLLAALFVPPALWLALSAGPAEAGSARTCLDDRLSAVGELADGLLRCHARAARRGQPVGQECIDKREAQYADAFRRARQAGGCDRLLFKQAAAVDARRVTDDLVARLVTQPDTEDGCAAGKLKAAGRRAESSLEAHGEAALGGDLAALSDGMGALRDAYDAKFDAIETKRACNTIGDAGTVADLVDTFADFSMASLGLIRLKTKTVASSARPADTPGSPGVDASEYPNLVTQFGGPDVDLNRATYTRFRYRGARRAPDAILIVVPGFEGGALGMKVLAENSITRAAEEGFLLEVWAYDRRGHQLEDRAGLDVSEAFLDPEIGVDWLFGEELGLDLDPALVAGPNRRAVFHDPHVDTAFMANWTSQVFSRDIDAVVEEARTIARDGNVFLGGHSAGTGFTARYAATDFDATGQGPPEPGYAKLRGLVLLEGGGGALPEEAPDDDVLDRIEDRFDGGLFHAVLDDAPRCVDGSPCESDEDCTGLGRGTCTEPTDAYAVLELNGIPFLNPKILATAEVVAIQGATDPNEGEIIVRVDQGGIPGNNVSAVVPGLGPFSLLPTATVAGFAGFFIDDDSELSDFAPFIRSSIGAPGPEVNGLPTWQSITQGPMPESVLTDNGPAPTDLPGTEWGQEVEIVRTDRLLQSFFVGDGNYVDWYYPSAGLSVTTGLGGLDSTALSVDRGRRDIENLTQAANVDVPVIAFGGSNGLTPVPGDYTAYASSLAPCAAASCDASTPRVVDALQPNPAFPTFGGVEGGFEVYLSEGMAHADVLALEDDSRSQLYAPLVDFLIRNSP